MTTVKQRLITLSRITPPKLQSQVILYSRVARWRRLCGVEDQTRGQRLAELRMEAGLKQRQVGAEFDIDKAAVSDWERDKTRPTVEKLARLDELYNARGEVLALFGIARSTLDERIAALEAEKASTSDAEERLLAIEAAVERLERRLPELQARAIKATGDLAGSIERLADHLATVRRRLAAVEDQVG